MSGIQKMIKNLLILKTQFTTDFEKWKYYLMAFNSSSRDRNLTGISERSFGGLKHKVLLEVAGEQTCLRQSSVAGFCLTSRSNGFKRSRSIYFFNRDEIKRDGHGKKCPTNTMPTAPQGQVGLCVRPEYANFYCQKYRKG